MSFEILTDKSSCLGRARKEPNKREPGFSVCVFVFVYVCLRLFVCIHVLCGIFVWVFDIHICFVFILSFLFF